MQRLRDSPACADAEHSLIANDSEAGLSYNLTFNPTSHLTLPSAFPHRRPAVAILREQGVNGHAEMAFAFHVAGFTPVDVHMTDLLSGAVDLADFTGLAACGGFSYGDCLSAGQGWAMSVLHNARLRKMFQAYFERKDTFTLGVCNGCQFLSKLQALIPGAEGWPSWQTNESEQYEARLCMVEILDPRPEEGASIFFRNMVGSKFPVAVAHGEGRASFRKMEKVDERDAMTALRYVHPTTLLPTTQYPYNPNGSPGGLAGVKSKDGRVLALMPHPERAVLADCVSWVPSDERERWRDGAGQGPWAKMFEGVREWVGA
jgi:phosphoribosylformylglycinamidine synthase